MPQDAEDMKEQGNRMFKGGRYVEALELCVLQSRVQSLAGSR